MYDGCNSDIAPLRLSNPSLLLMFKELCARRLLSAGENEYSTGYILCQQKFYFFSKIFHFFSVFFPGRENGGIWAGILPDDRGKAPGGGMPQAGPARPMGSGARPHSRGVVAALPPAGSGADGRGLLSHGRAAAR